jgi:flavin-dependent dehydrogenase
MSQVIETDVVVVGARVAGSATAMLLARQGVDVTVVDRATELGDVLSTHAVSRGGVVQLDRWGLLDEVLASGAPAIRTVSFHFGESVIRRVVKPTAGVDHLVAPRRRVLDNVVLDAARRAGADVRLGTAVEAVRPGGVVARTREGVELDIRAPLVVGADGLRSRVARQVGAAVLDERPSRTGVLFGYFAGHWDGFEFHVADGSFDGVFPTNDGLACVWAITDADRVEAVRRSSPSTEVAFRRLLAETAPGLLDRLGERAEPMHMALRYPNIVRQASGDGWALVGDAGYHRDAITGHGITDAFHHAELLAGAVLDGDLAAYGPARDAALRPIFDVTCELASFPPRERFVELQKQLSDHIEAEARALAAMPVPAAAAAAA